MKLISGVGLLMILAIAYLSPDNAFAQEEREPDPPIETIVELQIAIEKVLAETETPAVGIALVNKEGPYWVAGLGKADVEKDINADENTMFRIGSTSKIFVSLAILKLQEEGKVSLDDRVHDLIPEIEFQNQWEETDPIRVAHLLEHTTGWDDYHMPEYAHNDPTPVTLKQGLDFHPHSRISRWIPGTRMAYCNSGPPVAAFIVEKITGQRFEDYVEENFFGPMGVENMTYFLTETYQRLGATNYQGGEPQQYWHILMRPSGSINASAKDMAQIVKFFLNRGAVDGVQFLNPTSLKRMETPATTLGAKAGLQEGYGLNNYSSPHKEFIYREHRGSVRGARAKLAYLPEHGVGHAIMVNTYSLRGFEQISKLIRDFEIQSFDPPAMSKKAEFSGEFPVLDGYYLTINPRAQWRYSIERLFSFHRIWFHGKYLNRADFIKETLTKYLPVTDSLWKSVDTGLISIVKVVDPLDGEVLHVGAFPGTLVLKRVSAILVIGQLIIGGLWFLFMASAIPFALVWSVRRWRGSLSAGIGIRVRLWPLIASLLFVAALIAMGLTISGPREALVGPTAFSFSFMLLTIAFAAASVWSVFVVVKGRHTVMNAVAYWHSAALAGLHLVITLYLLWYGVIGFRFWA